MTNPFISEIRIFSFGFPPKGWALCDGQLLPIIQNQALFSLLGTTYGGDGRVNFGLPDLQSRVPMHFGDGFSLGELAGEQDHTLLLSELPVHTHLLQASTSAPGTLTADGNLLATPLGPMYAPPDANDTPLDPLSIPAVGVSEPHLNMAPFLTLSFCIATEGIFPSQN